MTPVQIARDLRDAVDALQFAPPVEYVYNPLDYAWNPHCAYLERFAQERVQVLLLGMNPGPFGMAQTGVPFGDVQMVRDWLGIEAPVGQPPRVHPKRPVAGFDCHRREVSGQRLWGWASERFGTPRAFFKRFFVANYCPLAFLEDSGRNRTPDKLPRSEREALFLACDIALQRLVKTLRPSCVVGIGGFAAQRAASALENAGVSTATAPHPSPASPIANRGWAQQMDRALKRLDIALD